jgi:hypothetical protein
MCLWMMMMMMMMMQLLFKEGCGFRYATTYHAGKAGGAAE